MHFTKPAWVVHKDSSAKSDTTKRLSIFSVHVHPDGSRIATGGLDAKVRIWSTKPILNPASEESNRPPKSLCTLTMHTGPVLTVRWAHSGRWLASGSDDEIVMIWDLDPNSRGKVWGSDEVNVEGWKPMKRLPGHESDVTDLAWAPEDRYLASVGLDSKIIIWCGYTLERLRKLDQHQGFVKGVCWDPVGEFLATQSDDRSVKIWRTSDWSLEAEVTKPFEDSPGSTFFRRLSWSPDGAHITASNATNNKGFVFIAAVITRGTWTSEISLVGHENTVEVAAYNPHIFLRNPSAPVATSNICSVVALGADDRSVSVWQTKSARPLIVAKEVFDRQIMDLSWSGDGMTLFAASSDGTLAVFDFERDELEGIAPHSVQQQYLSKFGFTPPPLPKGYSHVRSDPSTQLQSQQSQSTGFGSHEAGERINMLVAKRNDKKKKRIGLTQMAQVPSAGTSANGINAPTSKRASFLVPEAKAGSRSTSPGVFMQQDSFFPTPDEQPFDTHGGWDRDVDMVPIDAFGGGSSSKRMEDELKPIYRTLGGDRQRSTIPVRPLVPNSHASSSPSTLLPSQTIFTRVTSEVAGSDYVFEGVNPPDGGASSVVFYSGKQTLWLDYLPVEILLVHATTHFCAVTLLDGSVNVYSHSGRRIMPTLMLGSRSAFLHGHQNCLMVITEDGRLQTWQVNKGTSFFPPISVLPLQQNERDTILSANVRPNGCPVIHISSDIVYSYDPALCSFVKVSDKFWAEGSDHWQGLKRSTSQSANRGIMSAIEGLITPADSYADAPKPEWWNTALTLGHLETRLYTTRLLDSPVEYKQTLMLYARKIADEGFRSKAEELIKDLCGPIYWRPGEERGECWAPKVAGMAKRDLLKEVLSVFVKSKTLTKLAMDWQDVLKKIASEEF